MAQKTSTERPHTVPTRLSDTGFSWVEDQRKYFDVSRSDVIREALAVAANHQAELTKRLTALTEGF